MQVFPQKLFILRLKGRVPGHPRLRWLKEMSVEDCIEKLRKLSGRDFGDDVAKWEQWWCEEKKRLGLPSDYL